jgi:hypothetical protein
VDVSFKEKAMMSISVDHTDPKQFSDGCLYLLADVNASTLFVGRYIAERDCFAVVDYLTEEVVVEVSRAEIVAADRVQ